MSDQRKRTLARNKRWRGITEEAFDGYCLKCGKGGQLFGQGLWGIWGHHKDGNRNNCTRDNCYPVHNYCHTIITDTNEKI